MNMCSFILPCQNHILFQTKKAKSITLFQTKTAPKSYPLERHISILSLYIGVPHLPCDAYGFAIQKLLAPHKTSYCTQMLYLNATDLELGSSTYSPFLFSVSGIHKIETVLHHISKHFKAHQLDIVSISKSNKKSFTLDFGQWCYQFISQTLVFRNFAFHQRYRRQILVLGARNVHDFKRVNSIIFNPPNLQGYDMH